MKRPLLIFALLLSLPALAGDIYIAQTAAGADSGASCATAHSAAWFNSNAAGGNTYHLCGIFTGTANTTMLTVPASGTAGAGNALMILFETDAVLTSPAWGTNGAIYINGKNYIVVDGGTNGIIKNTDNGTTGAKTNNIDSYGVKVVGASSNIEIKNLTIQDIYVKSGTTVTGQGAGIAYGGTGGTTAWGTDISVHNNTVSSGFFAILFNLNGDSSGLHIYNNLVSDACRHIVVSEDNAGHTFSDIAIYGNTVTNWGLWGLPTSCHTDGIMVWAAGSGSTMPVSIYNNYVHGNLQPQSPSGSPTAKIFCTYGTGSPGAVCAIYNNLLVNEVNNSVPIWLKCGQPGNQIYNNTIIGLGNTGGTAIRFETSTTTAILKNNIISGFKLGYDSYNDPATQATSDTNDFYNLGASYFYAKNISGSPTFYSLAQWKTNSSQDANSLTSDPALNAVNYYPGSSSPAGTDLSGLGITALNSDRGGNLRSAWKMGAYEAVKAITALPATLTYADQETGTSSATQDVTVTNTGGLAVTFTGGIAAALTWATGTQWTKTTTCGNTLAGGATCPISITFSPDAAGTPSDTLSIASDATGSPHTVVLSGTAHVGGPLAPTCTLACSPSVVVLGGSSTCTIAAGGGACSSATINGTAKACDGNSVFTPTVLVAFTHDGTVTGPGGTAGCTGTGRTVQRTASPPPGIM